MMRYVRPYSNRMAITFRLHDLERNVEVPARGWRDRVHFFAVAAQMMRRILVDAARARATAKRCGEMVRIEPDDALNLDGLPALSQERARDVCALDEALASLVRLDPRRAQVVELRFFGGLTIQETAEVMGVSPQTVIRDWGVARAWLTRELRP